MALPDESLGAPPAWLDSDQVAIVQRGRDARTLIAVIDLATEGVIDRIPFRALALGTSGDGHTAVVLGDESRLLVGPTADVLERRRAPDGGPDLAPGDVVRGGVALDRDGRRLAAVVEDTAGISRIATFVRAGDAWQPDVRIPGPARLVRRPARLAALTRRRRTPAPGRGPGSGSRVPAASVGASADRGDLFDGREDGNLRSLGEHLTEDLLQGQLVNAALPALEVVARAVPGTGVETHVVRVVVASKRDAEAIERQGDHAHARIGSPSRPCR